MSSKYPPLTPKQVCRILEARGFRLTNKTGDHRIYEDDKGHNVQADMVEKDFGISGMKIIIRNSGLTREEFYGSTKQTAQKIGAKYDKKALIS